MRSRVNEVGSGVSGPFEDAFEAVLDAGTAVKVRKRAEATRRLRAVTVNRARRLGQSKPLGQKAKDEGR